MSSVPFMQLYVADYLGDTQHLTTEQHGAYLLILMAMWRAGGSLPAEAGRLARISRVTSSRWKKIGNEVLAFFAEEDGMLTQKRLRREIEKASDISRKRSSAGSRGAAAKHVKEKTLASANAEDLPAHTQIPESNTTPANVEQDRATINAVAAACRSFATRRLAGRRGRFHRRHLAGHSGALPRKATGIGPHARLFRSRRRRGAGSKARWFRRERAP